MQQYFKYYRFAAIVTALAVPLVWIFMGAADAGTVAILAVLEWTLSFDNAIVNGKILQRMSHKWRLVFMTFGMLIAVGFMRLLFPILIVMVSAKLGLGDTVSLALYHPAEYGARLADAHPIIAMFGGTYLLLIALGWLFDNDRDVHWLRWLEAPLARAGKADNLMYIVAGAFTLLAATTFGSAHQVSILLSGVSAIVIFLIVEAVSNYFDEKETDGGLAKGWHAFSLFMYLEVQDAAFSFDGVNGAFAISTNVILIAIGLGLGALYVRSMTNHFVDLGLLDDEDPKFPYLEHGAYWAITSLAVCLLMGVADIEVPEYVTGGLGLFFIGIAVWQSVRLNKAKAAEALANQSSASEATEAEDDESAEVTA